MGITLSKPHLVCTFYNKQINAKKCEWKFGSVQILMARQCICISQHYVYIVQSCLCLSLVGLKAHVLNVSDKEKSLGCLRRQDKLSN